ncbi:unnamed protein product [Pedinophyceae sp. YPF-701]|nr:unnamed protein product [Pedinophyceae sp. YPF-701]CAG9462120.1 unnamed protein product [Pedinophyceae sp. YPF-701]
MSNCEIVDLPVLEMGPHQVRESLRCILHSVLLSRALGVVRPEETDSEVLQLSYVRCGDPEIHKAVEKTVAQLEEWLGRQPEGGLHTAQLNFFEPRVRKDSGRSQQQAQPRSEQDQAATPSPASRKSWLSSGSSWLGSLTQAVPKSIASSMSGTISELRALSSSSSKVVWERWRMHLCVLPPPVVNAAGSGHPVSRSNSVHLTVGDAEAEAARRRDALTERLLEAMRAIAAHSGARRDHLPPVLDATATVPFRWELVLPPQASAIPGLDAVKRMLTHTSPPPVAI